MKPKLDEQQALRIAIDALKEISEIKDHVESQSTGMIQYFESAGAVIARDTLKAIQALPQEPQLNLPSLKELFVGLGCSPASAEFNNGYDLGAEESYVWLIEEIKRRNNNI